MKNKVGGIVVAKICGEHTCSQCGTVIAWEYHIPNKLSSGQCEIEDIIFLNTTHLELTVSRQAQSPYELPAQIAVSPTNLFATLTILATRNK